MNELNLGAGMCQEMLTYFMGAVKTASAQFPKKWLCDWFNKCAENNVGRGHWVTLSSSYVNPVKEAAGQVAVAESFPMYEVGWMDKRLKAIVCNCSTTVQAMTNSVRRRHRKIIVDGSYSTEARRIEIKWPEAIRQFFQHFGAIDVHDHYRQGILGMERTWLTKKWWIRLFTTILGVIFVNSYFAYRLLYKRSNHDSTEGIESFDEFLGHLAYELIFNDYLNEGVVTSPRNRTVAIQVEVINSNNNLNELLFDYDLFACITLGFTPSLYKSIFKSSMQC